MTETLVFDWGNTLMLTNPAYTGAMVSWPRVQAAEGISEALACLAQKYTLIVATNAVDSNAEQVRAALERVGLARYFSEVFTSARLNGSRKPQVAYFHALENALGCPPEHLVMIGDEYTADVLGAWQAGWRTLWYNPSHVLCPGLRPVHDGEISHFSNLAQALDQMTLPAWNVCQVWMREFNLPYNLCQHVEGVSAVAYTLGVWLHEQGEPVNPLLAQRGGLLHDLAKIPVPGAIADNKHHGDRAADFLLSRNQPVLAEIARRHVMHGLAEPQNAPRTWEEKLVYFADKLMEGARLVELDERLEALCIRYPNYSDSTRRLAPNLHYLQAELCAAMRFSPAELLPRLRNAFRNGNAIQA